MSAMMISLDEYGESNKPSDRKDRNDRNDGIKTSENKINWNRILNISSIIITSISTIIMVSLVSNKLAEMNVQINTYKDLFSTILNNFDNITIAHESIKTINKDMPIINDRLKTSEETINIMGTLNTTMLNTEVEAINNNNLSKAITQLNSLNEQLEKQILIKPIYQNTVVISILCTFNNVDKLYNGVIPNQNSQISILNGQPRYMNFCVYQGKIHNLTYHGEMLHYELVGVHKYQINTTLVAETNILLYIEGNPDMFGIKPRYGYEIYCELPTCCPNGYCTNLAAATAMPGISDILK